MAVIALVSAFVEAIDAVTTPLAFVVDPGCVSVLPVPVDAIWTVWPLTGFPFASLTVTVIVELLDPLATTFVLGHDVAVDREALIVDASAVNPTVGCCVTMTCPAPGLIVAVIVFVSATVEATEAVATPAASVVDPGCVSVLPVPVDAIWTVWPGTAFPFASLTVTVIVELLAPFATTLVDGDAAAVDSDALIVDTSPMNPTAGC